MPSEATTLMNGWLRRFGGARDGGPNPSAEVPRDLLDSLDLVLWEAEAPDWRVTWVSPNAEEQFGWPLATWTGGEIWRLLIHPDDRSRVQARLYGIAEGSSTGGGAEFRIVTADGESRWIHGTLRALRDGGRTRLRGAMLDVSATRHAEQTAIHNEERIRQLIENAADAFLVHDADGRFVEANPSACEMLGYSRQELVGMRVGDVQLDLNEAKARSTWNTLEPRRSVTFDTEYRRRDGSTVPVEVKISAVSRGGQRQVIAVARDTSERRRIEQQLRHSQKMEAVGRLAGGVAHDFNNLLTAIKGHAELLIQELDDDAATRDLAEISRAADRAAVLTRKLLAFSRQQIFSPEVIDLNEIVLETGRLLRPLIGEHLDFRTDLGAIGRVRADHGQIEQVLVNLVVNARDAMPAGGALQITTSNLDVDDDNPYRHPFVRHGRYVALRVSDTGTGMDAETLGRVFEPFFTTKEKGKGSGLGLAIAYGIVKQSGGYLVAESEPGRGSHFHVILPRSDILSEVAALEAGEPGMARGDSPVALVVEDEPPVRALVARVLARDGFHVIEAGSGEEAIVRARDFDGAIDVVISDLVMTGMDGRELAHHLAGTRPELRFILMSGFNDIVPRLESDPDTISESMLYKPFTPAELSRRVREVLSGMPSSRPAL